jgi:hypothetical protein
VRRVRVSAGGRALVRPLVGVRVRCARRRVRPARSRPSRAVACRVGVTGGGLAVSSAPRVRSHVVASKIPVGIVSMREMVFAGGGAGKLPWAGLPCNGKYGTLDPRPATEGLMTLDSSGRSFSSLHQRAFGAAREQTPLARHAGWAERSNWQTRKIKAPDFRTTFAAAGGSSLTTATNHFGQPVGHMQTVTALAPPPPVDLSEYAAKHWRVESQSASRWSNQRLPRLPEFPVCVTDYGNFVRPTPLTKTTSSSFLRSPMHLAGPLGS